jgi:hypothetical protein
MRNKTLRGIEVLRHPRFTPLALKTDGMAWERKVLRPKDNNGRSHLRGASTIIASLLMAYK